MPFLGVTLIKIMLKATTTFNKGLDVTISWLNGYIKALYFTFLLELFQCDVCASMSPFPFFVLAQEAVDVKL